MTNVMAFLAGGPTPQRPTGMQTAQPWDAALNMMKRLETSVPLSRFLFDEMNRVKFHRDGLGPWTGYLEQVSGHGFVIATPMADTPFGASVWFDQRLTCRQAAALTFRMMSKGPVPAFLTSAGRKVAAG